MAYTIQNGERDTAGFGTDSESDTDHIDYSMLARPVGKDRAFAQTDKEAKAKNYTKELSDRYSFTAKAMLILAIGVSVACTLFLAHTLPLPKANAAYIVAGLLGLSFALFLSSTIFACVSIYHAVKLFGGSPIPFSFDCGCNFFAPIAFGIVWIVYGAQCQSMAEFECVAAMGVGAAMLSLLPILACCSCVMSCGIGISDKVAEVTDTEVQHG